MSPSASPTAEPETNRRKQRRGQVVFYRLHPDADKVDRYCGAFGRSYVTQPVEIAPGDEAVLTRALETLFSRVWSLDSVVRSVEVTDGRATIDLTSWDGLGFAGTSCGGVGFRGSVLRTVFQFDNVREARILIGGSCHRFGELMMTGRCETFTRENVSR